MKRRRLAAYLRACRINDSKLTAEHADAIMQASDDHVIRSFVRREGLPILRKFAPSQIDEIVEGAVSGEEFVSMVVHGTEYDLPEELREELRNE